jgi:hypothetical protein
MTALGFHYFPDDTHYRAADLQAWLPELKALGAQWLTVVGSLSRAVPEPFIQGLKGAGIEPIIHIPSTPIRAIDGAALQPLLATYARWGVRYVSLFSEPNARSAWARAEWGKTALIDRFLEISIPVFQAQADVGLEPVFPALKAGGDYWDTAFLEASLAGLARRGQTELARQLTFAVNLWTFNRPVSWGAGGLRRWPQARPYLTPLGVEDQRGFHLFDWYNEIIEARTGELRPLLCLAGGPCLGDQTDGALPPIDEARHASCTHEVAQMISANALPVNVKNVNFWLLAAPEASPFAHQAWYRADGSTLPAVDALRRLAEQNRRPKSASSGPAKTLQHYLLLPTFEWGVSEWHWNAALDYVKAHRPLCGFSPEEAAQAQRVTLFGNEQGISREVEAALRRAGCVVERVSAENGG